MASFPYHLHLTGCKAGLKSSTYPDMSCNMYAGTPRARPFFVFVGKEPLRKTHRLAVLRRSIHTGKTLMSEMLRSRAKDGITLS